jgi:N-ethylmaleimide reductase
MLFSPYQLGHLTLPNRIIMPPMTRARATSDGLATRLMADYYAQRASAGLIISEGTQISQQGQGYAWTPGIYTPAQVKAWQQVTHAVHQQGGRIYAQLWHVGRLSHTSLQAAGQSPVSSSALQAKGVKVFIDPEKRGPALGPGEMVQHSMPRALERHEIGDIINDFRQAAENALSAGFDGIELHAANGYLINQFLDSRANTREDEYGGSLENRLRFLSEVVTAITQVYPPARAGVRLSPLTTQQGTIDDTPEATYLAAASRLQELNVGYLHIAEADWSDAPIMPIPFKQALRLMFHGTLIYSGNYNKDKANQAISAGWADLIGFGRAFIANPDLPERLRSGYPLASLSHTHLFGGEAEGYTDYPVYTAD